MRTEPRFSLTPSPGLGAAVFCVFFCTDGARGPMALKAIDAGLTRQAGRHAGDARKRRVHDL